MIIVSKMQTKNPGLIKSITKIQSHIRGLIVRQQFSKKIVSLGKFIPYLDPDMPFKIASESKIVCIDILIQ